MDVRQVVPRDAIPSVDDPEFRETYAGDPDDRVVVIEADPPRAYPLRYLDFHEIVNDRLDAGDDGNGQPVAVTWCPLCGAAVVHSREVDGRVLAFGVSGKLADDDLVMYDRETESEWKQSTGEAIAGPLAGERLATLPARTTTWAAFRERSPHGVVLAPPGGRSEAAGEGEDPAPIAYDEDPYRAYFEADGFGLDAHRGGDGREDWALGLDPKAVVVGLERDGEAVGLPAERVRAADGAVRVTVGGDEVVVFATDAGVAAYEAPGFDDGFEPVDGGEFAADGTTWDPTTGESADGRRLAPAPARRLFAFAWRDDHGAETLWTP